jgi:hypothetical protein
MISSVAHGVNLLSASTGENAFRREIAALGRWARRGSCERGGYTPPATAVFENSGQDSRRMADVGNPQADYVEHRGHRPSDNVLLAATANQKGTLMPCWRLFHRTTIAGV